MKLYTSLFLIFLTLGSSPPSWGQLKVRLNWSATTGTQSGFWIAQEEGIFKRNTGLTPSSCTSPQPPEPFSPCWPASSPSRIRTPLPAPTPRSKDLTSCCIFFPMRRQIREKFARRYFRPMLGRIAGALPARRGQLLRRQTYRAGTQVSISPVKQQCL